MGHEGKAWPRIQSRLRESAQHYWDIMAGLTYVFHTSKLEPKSFLRIAVLVFVRQCRELHSHTTTGRLHWHVSRIGVQRSGVRLQRCVVVTHLVHAHRSCMSF